MEDFTICEQGIWGGGFGLDKRKMKAMGSGLV